MNKFLVFVVVLSVVAVTFAEPQRQRFRSNRFLSRQEVAPAVSPDEQSDSSGSAPYPPASTPAGPAFELPSETTEPSNEYGPPPPSDSYGPPPSNEYGPPSSDPSAPSAPEQPQQPAVDQNGDIPEAERLIFFGGSPRSRLSVVPRQSNANFGRIQFEQLPIEIQRVLLV